MDGVYTLFAFLQGIIVTSAVARIIYCLICINMDSDQAATYKRRIRNIVVFLVLSQCIAATIVIIKSYY